MSAETTFVVGSRVAYNRACGWPYHSTGTVLVATDDGYHVSWDGEDNPRWMRPHQVLPVVVEAAEAQEVGQ